MKVLPLREPSVLFSTLLRPSSYVNIGYYGVIMALSHMDTDILDWPLINL